LSCLVLFPRVTRHICPVGRHVRLSIEHRHTTRYNLSHRPMDDWTNVTPMSVNDTDTDTDTDNTHTNLLLANHNTGISNLAVCFSDRFQRSISAMHLHLCSAVQCSAVQCSAVQCSAVQCSAVQSSAVQCSAHPVLLGLYTQLNLDVISMGRSLDDFFCPSSPPW
jgi:hypothetical protein